MENAGASADAVLDTAQNNKLSSQSDVAAQSAAVFNTAQTPVAQLIDPLYTAPRLHPHAAQKATVAQPIDPLYTAPRLHPHAAQTAAAPDTEPPQSLHGLISGATQSTSRTVARSSSAREHAWDGASRSRQETLGVVLKCCTDVTEATATAAVQSEDHDGAGTELHRNRQHDVGIA
jgi:hypothetical protein